MESVLISIKPKYCEKIASGEKTIEVRKTRPKLETPFRCYIYCTENGAGTHPTRYVWKKRDDGFGYYWNGKVIGEFVCDNIFYSAKTGYMGSGVKPSYNIGVNLLSACMSYEQLEDYTRGRPIFGWHISDLKIYDKPKESSVFRKPCVDKYQCCQECEHGLVKYPAWVETREDLDGVCFDNECLNTVTRAPQSWMYVEGLE